MSVMCQFQDEPMSVLTFTICATYWSLVNVQDAPVSIVSQPFNSAGWLAESAAK